MFSSSGGQIKFYYELVGLIHGSILAEARHRRRRAVVRICHSLTCHTTSPGGTLKASSKYFKGIEIQYTIAFPSTNRHSQHARLAIAWRGNFGRMRFNESLSVCEGRYLII